MTAYLLFRNKRSNQLQEDTVSFECRWVLKINNENDVKILFYLEGKKIRHKTVGLERVPFLLEGKITYKKISR